MATDTEINQLPSQDPSLTDVVPYSKGDLQTFKTTWQKIVDLVPSPTPYKIYLALVSQVGASPPVMTIIQNTIGNIAWNYDGVGAYDGTLLGAFTLFKTICLVSNITSSNGSAAFQPDGIGADSVTILTFDNTGTPSDGILVNNQYFVEIRVYN